MGSLSSTRTTNECSDEMKGYTTSLDFRKKMSATNMRRGYPFNAIFFPEKVLESVYKTQRHTEVGIEAYAELLIRSWLNPDREGVLFSPQECGRTRDIIKLLSSIELIPDGWGSIRQQFENRCHLSNATHFLIVERRVKALLSADGFIPVCGVREGGIQTEDVYFLPFKFISCGQNRRKCTDGIRLFDWNSRLLVDQSWAKKLEKGPDKITDDIQFLYHEDIEDPIGTNGESLMLPVMMAWWRHTGKIQRYNHLRVMGTGKFEGNCLRDVSTRRKIIVFEKQIKGGVFIHPGNKGSLGEIPTDLHVDFVRQKVTEIVSPTVPILLRTLRERWGIENENIFFFKARFVERLKKLKDPMWFERFNSRDTENPDGEVNLIKAIVGMMNSPTGGCIVIVGGHSTKSAFAEDVVTRTTLGLKDCNGHMWRVQRSKREQTEDIRARIKCWSPLEYAGEQLTLMCIAPSKYPVVLERKCEALPIVDGCGVPVCSEHVFLRDGCRSREFPICDLLLNWDGIGCHASNNPIVDAIERDNHDVLLCAPDVVDRIIKKTYDIAAFILEQCGNISARRSQNSWIVGNRHVLLYFGSGMEGPNSDLYRFAELVLNEVRNHEWGNPVPVILRISAEDLQVEPRVNDYEVLLRLLCDGYLDTDVSFREWRTLVNNKLLALCVMYSGPVVDSAGGLRSLLVAFARQMARLTGNVLVWHGQLPVNEFSTDEVEVISKKGENVCES